MRLFQIYRRFVGSLDKVASRHPNLVPLFSNYSGVQVLRNNLRKPFPSSVDEYCSLWFLSIIILTFNLHFQNYTWNTFIRD